MKIEIKRIRENLYRVFWDIGSGEHSVPFETEIEARAYLKGADHIFEEITEYLPRHKAK